MPVLPVVGTFPAAPNASLPGLEIEWAPTSGPTQAPVWTSIASRMRGMSTRRGRNTELEQYRAGTLSLLLDNQDRYLDPTYTSSPWYGSVVPNRPFRVRASWSGTQYDLGWFYADGFPQDYPGFGKDSVVQLTATDGFKIFAAIDLINQYEYQLQTDRPDHLWRLDELSFWTSATAYDSGYAGTLYDGDYHWGVRAGEQPIRLGSRASTKFAHSATAGQDAYVAVSFNALPPAASTAFTFECWFTLDGDSTRTQGLFSAGGNPAGGNNFIEAYVTPNDTPQIQVQSDLRTTSFVGVTDDTIATEITPPHHLVVTYTASAAWTCYLDGTPTSTDSTGIPATFTFDTTFFRIGKIQFTGPIYAGLTGWMSDFAIYYGKALTATQVANHYNAGANGFSGEGTGTRMGRILDQIGWPAARRTIATGDVDVGIHVTEGNVLDYFQKLAQTEAGEFYMEVDGNVMWRDRSALADDARSNSSQATFGDGGGSELPYVDIVINYDEVQIRNDVTITPDGGTPQRATDATSIDRYGRHTYTESGSYDETDATALTKAEAILAKYKDPKLRVTQIVIDPLRDPNNLFPEVLGRKIGDRITVKRRPMDVGSAISQDCWIEGIDHDVSPGIWKTTFQLVACS
jgi:hypothetical protein